MGRAARPTGHGLPRRLGQGVGGVGQREERGQAGPWLGKERGGSVGLLPLAGPVQGEGEGNAGPGQGVRGEKREGNRFSNLCLNGLNLDLRRIHHILGRVSKVKYKAVFEESFGGIHMNSRQNFHECSDGNFPGDIRKDSKGEFEGNSGESAWSLNRNFKRGIDGT